MSLPEVAVRCPYCGESVACIVEPHPATQDTIEDCPVCCRPMRLLVACADTPDPLVTALREDDVP